MPKNILTPSGKVIKCIESQRINNNLLEGLKICIYKISRMENDKEIEEYLSFGNTSYFNLKEEIARLLLLATTLPVNVSPVIDIGTKSKSDDILNINSMFIKELFNSAHRKKKNSFINSDFYKSISSKVEEMEVKYHFEKRFYLGDGIVLIKNIRNLYISNVDNSLASNKLDFRYREPLIELFQYILDCTLKRIRNGV